MSSLEQSVAVDYYKILGVPKNANAKFICAQYIHFNIATVNYPSPIILHSNIKIPTKLTVASQKLQKLLTCSMTVFNHLYSRKA